MHYTKVQKSDLKCLFGPFKKNLLAKKLYVIDKKYFLCDSNQMDKFIFCPLHLCIVSVFCTAPFSLAIQVESITLFSRYHSTLGGGSPREGSCQLELLGLAGSKYIIIIPVQLGFFKDCSMSYTINISHKVSNVNVRLTEVITSYS